MKIRIATAFILSALVSGNAYAIDLQDSMTAAYQYNNQLKSQQNQLLSTQEQVPSAYAGFMPQAVLDGSVRRGETNNLLTENYGSNLWNNDHNHDFQLLQPIFNGGGTISQVNHAYNVVAAATSDLQTVEEQTLINAISAHMDVVRAAKVLDLSKDNEQVLKEQLNSSMERFKLGEATKTDVSQSQARYSRAISDRIKAEGDLNAAMANYGSTVGHDQTSVDPNSFVMPNMAVALPETLDEALDRAFKNNPALASQIYQEKASENDVTSAYAQLLPSLNLRGAISRDTDTFGQPINVSAMGASTDIHDNEESVTLNLTVPLYQGGSEYARIRQAKKTRESNKYLVQARKDSLRANIVKAWEDILTSRASIKSYSDAVKSATLALSGVKREQEVGARTILDVLDAEQELYLEKINLINVQKNEVVAVFNLKYHLGELTAKEMKLPVKIFNPEDKFRYNQFKMIGF